MAKAATYKVYNGSAWEELTFTPSSHTHTKSEITDLSGNLIYYIEGTGSTAGTWLGSHDDITEYYDGLTITYKIPVAGASTTKLNINGLGAVTVYMRGTTKVTTHYAVGTVVQLVYTTVNGTGRWYSSDYDANSDTKVTQAYRTTNENRPLLMSAGYTSANTSGSSATTSYWNPNIYANPSTGALYATTLYEGDTSLADKYSTLANTIKSLSISGKTITYTKGDGTTGTLTTQDTNTTYSAATDSALGLVMVGGVRTIANSDMNSTTSSSGRFYKVERSSATNQLFVNVPWTDTDTTYSKATSSALGLVKIGYSENGKNYPVELDSDGKMFVNVPWTDNNTTYTLSSFGITATAAELNYVDGVTSNIQTQLNGKAASSHTHSQYLTSTSSVSEAYLTWGGRNFAGSYGPIDAAMVPELGANRLAFFDPAAIIIEYSTDGGSTWTAYSTTDAAKSNLFNGNGATYTIGGSTTTGIDKTNHRLRITLNTKDELYTVLNKFCLSITTSGSSGCWCTIDARLQSNYEAGTDTWKVFANQVSISGWSGYNIINTSGITTYGNTKTSQYGQVRFTFGVTSHASTVTYPGLSVMKIMGFGGVGWTIPSTMAKTGNIFTYDHNQNVTFPAGVTATSFNGTTLYEGGTSLANKYSTLANTIKALSISGKTITYTKGDGTTGTLTTQDTNTTYSKATSSALGLVKIGYSENGKNYPVELNTDGQMFVNVPWTDTDNNTTYSIATASTAGLVKPVSVITKPTLQSVTTTAGKYYQVQMSSDGNMFVNVPWTDNNTTYTFTNKAATLSWGATTTIATVGGTDITVKMPANPDTNTTYSKATSSALGLVKIGYTENGKNYPVELNTDGQMFVNVPWTDTNTDTDTGATSVTVSGSGNAVTSASYDASTRKLTLTKGTTFLTSHQTMYYRPIQVNGTQILANTANTALNLKAGSNVSITNSSGTVTIAATNTTYSNATTSAAGLMSADDKKNLTYYVKGTQTASTNAWTGNLTQVSALYEGLTIRYRLPYAGASTGATLNLTLSGGTTGAKNVYRYGTTTQITTHFAANSVITMTYNGTNWIVDAFYDSNSYAYVRQYKTTTDATYPLLFAYETALPSSYDTKYTRKNSNLTFNPSTGQLNATILSAGIASSTNGKVVFQNTEGGTVTLTPGVESGSNVTLYLPENNGKRLMLGIATTDGIKYADDEGLVTNTLTTKTYVDNAVANAGGGSSGDCLGGWYSSASFNGDDGYMLGGEEKCIAMDASTGTFLYGTDDENSEIATVKDVAAASQYTLLSRNASVASGSNVSLASLLASYNDIMIIVRATHIANSGVAIKTTANSVLCSKLYTTAGTYYTKIVINRTSDGYTACDIGGSFGWVSGTALNLVVTSNGAATVVYYYR